MDVIPLGVLDVLVDKVLNLSRVLRFESIIDIIGDSDRIVRFDGLILLGLRAIVVLKGVLLF